ncbi:hypothetical protein F4604DRAFT_1681659 [Suillus subluteus]|nr:hypothetical protein F4604DRAFT_1681659 [Suillus subluteus]
MSAPVQTSLASLKAATAQLVDIISGARHIPAGTGEAHLALTAKATTLVGAIVRDFQNGPYMPGVVASCSKELLRHRPRRPPGVQTCLAFSSPGSGGEQEAQVPFDFGSALRTSKVRHEVSQAGQVNSHVKSSLVVESEDDDDAIIKPISSGVPEVVLPRSSTIIKQAFGPASLTAGVVRRFWKPPAVIPPPLVIPLQFLHLILPFLAQTTPAIIAPKRIGPAKVVWTRGQALPVCLASAVPPRSSNVNLHPWDPRPHGLAVESVSWPIPSSGHPCSSLTRGPVTWSQEDQQCKEGCYSFPCPCPCPCPAPAPAPAPALAPAPPAIVSSSSRVPPAALDVPMPDLHSMAIAIRDGAARIALLETRVREQDDKIDTLQRLHESLRRKVVDRHPSFPLPDSPAPATFLLDQSITPSMSPLPSALPNLINLDMGVMEPSSLKVEDASDMVGLIFEPSPVQPDGPQPSSKIEDPDDPGNLVPEYNSVSEEMDVEVKDETSGEHIGDHRVVTPDSRLPSSGCRDSGLPAPGTRDSMNILEITESVTPDSRVPAAGTPGCRHPVGSQSPSRDSRLPSAGCRDSGLPAPGSRESCHILTPDSWVPATRRPGNRNSGVGSQESRLGDLQNVHLSEIKKYEHIGDHRVVTPDSRVPAAGTPGCRHPGVGSWELGLDNLQYVHLSEIKNVIDMYHFQFEILNAPTESRVPGAGNPESWQPELGSQESRLGDLQYVNILEITESRLPSSGFRDSGLPAPGTRASVLATRSPGSRNSGVRTR